MDIFFIFKLSFSIAAALTYCYFITTKIPKGILRLLSLLPIILLFSLIPLHLTSAFNTAIAVFFLTWLGNFKLILFAFETGPLCSNSKKLSFPLFIAFSILPIRSKTVLVKRVSKFDLCLATEVVLLGVLFTVVDNYRGFIDSIHTKLIWVFYCLQTFLLVDVLIAGSNGLAKVLFGLELEPPSNKPYLATSLQDFWGRRWNLMVTNILRITIYKPVRSFAAHLVGEPTAKLTAIIATFLVSGLMHELLFYYVTKVSPTWEMTGFFVLHGVCVVVEFGLKKVFAGRRELPEMVLVVLTVGFVVATSFWLFFPPIINSGADTKVLDEFSMFVGYVKNIVPSQLKIF
ncbi:long-chain-alcohol O-fatty-acyltransferase-like [Impatiens glandulifera]|uniref:long-chain-alcohol O-fatty-acyltransferase-like n=1 Tax=Impatiens glandulifera TaxID=253017 RepID=UPI001FB15CA3|nr:long-chain-alcohol O-fatty-acyltransferase-like [Impatiens glandulifera]